MAFCCQYSQQRFWVGEVFFVHQTRKASRTFLFFDLFFLLQFRSSVLLANLQCVPGAASIIILFHKELYQVAPTVGREEDRYTANNTRPFIVTNNNFKFLERGI
jgi:hypothetical protein